MGQLLSLGTELKVKFRMPMFQQGFVEALATVAEIEGGEDGGQVVATGTPEQVAQVEASHTGRYIKVALAEGRSHAYATGH